MSPVMIDTYHKQLDRLKNTPMLGAKSEAVRLAEITIALLTALYSENADMKAQIKNLQTMVMINGEK